MPESPKQRLRALEGLEKHLELPMLILAVVWIALIVVEAADGLPPLLRGIGYAIWVVFILEFALRFWIAPHKLRFLERNWLSALALVVPALRVFRIFQAIRLLQLAQVSRGLSLVRVVAAFNRGMNSLGRTLGRRGFVYVVAITAAVVFLGAAGMLQFEGKAFKDYWDAVWWSLMVVFTIGSNYWPVTNEGRILTSLMAAYGFAILGYIAATLASFFVDQDVKHAKDEVTLKTLHDDIQALRAEIQALKDQSPSDIRKRISLE